jgi:hypothetical protein
MNPIYTVGRTINYLDTQTRLISNKPSSLTIHKHQLLIGFPHQETIQPKAHQTEFSINYGQTTYLKSTSLELNHNQYK